MCINIGDRVILTDEILDLKYCSGVVIPLTEMDIKFFPEDSMSRIKLDDNAGEYLPQNLNWMYSIIERKDLKNY